MLRLTAGCEGLDDDHAAAAARAWTRQHARFVDCWFGRLGFGRDGTASSWRACAMLSARLPLASSPCGWPNGVGLGVTATDIGNLRLALMALLPNIAGWFCALGWRFGRKSKQPSG
jgi:hypothetical protein